jgi:hypothetical protein
VRRDDTATAARLLGELDARLAPEEIGALLDAIFGTEPVLLDRATQAAPRRALCA